jgi:tripartite-type tricarboxylate transporter receptor subunit TctC
MRLQLSLVLIGAALAAAFTPAHAQEASRVQEAWPQQPVTIIVPFSAGGSTDVLARIVAQHMQIKLGHPVVVQNRSGAGGAIGAMAVAKAPADGYTIMIGTGGSQVTMPITTKVTAYDPENDFAPVSLIAVIPSLLVVNPSVPAKTVPELVSYLRANPDKITYGSAGTGTASHLAVELFAKRIGAKMTHVPYRSTGDNANALTGGHVQLAIDHMAVIWPQAQAGNLRALAVTTRQRVPSAPDVPALAETLKDYEVLSWIGMVAPAATPRPIIDILNAEVKRIVNLPEVAKTLQEVGAIPAANTPEEFAAFLKTERSTWSDVIGSLGLAAK